MSKVMPAAVLDTLETLIAPGKRVRLSPFVETAQFSILMGEPPDDRRRAESSWSILERNEERFQQIARHWTKFTEQGKDFVKNDYTHPDFLDAYLAYYFSVNVPKVQLVLLDLVRDGLLSGEINLLDIGVGTGTTAIAILDFLLAWGQVCDLYSQPFPVTNVRLVGIDRSEGSLGHAQRVVQAYAEAIQRRLESRPVTDAVPIDNGRTRQPDILERIHEWALAATWEQHDLGTNVPTLDVTPNLVVLANVLNELNEPGKTNLDTFLRGLLPGAMTVVIEPGTERNARNLMKWRRHLVNESREFVAIGPCGQEFGYELPSSCDNCWNARREDFHQPLLYEKFRDAAVNLAQDNFRRADEYENKLLSWSYVVLRKQNIPVSPSKAPQRRLRNGEMIREMIQVRYIGTYKDREPASYNPDEFKANGTTGAWNEYLKLCSAGYQASRIALKRLPGLETPPLRFGQEFGVSNVQVRYLRQGVVELSRLENEVTEFPALDAVDPNSGFLVRYDDSARRAIDELAYRMFGFSGMRDFQHRILNRVLTGQHILGIAATGGGKSECFILPAMLLPGVTIVVAPLKSLMADQYEQRIRRRYGLDHLTTYINGDVPFVERQARLRRMELGYYKLVYFTPEQLERGWILDSLRRTHDAVGVRYLAMDEAHCISQWGHDFRPAYLNLSRRLKSYGMEPVRIALTATASPDVRKDICDELSLNPAPLDAGGDVFVESSNRPELNLIVRVMRSTPEKASAILEDLQGLVRNNQNNQEPGAAIVFMPWTGGDPDRTNLSQAGPRAGQNSAGVSHFAAYLERRLGQRVAIYHGKMDTDTSSEESAQQNPQPPKPLGDMSGRTRPGEQNAFIEGKRAIMVATKGFGMGIDKPNIRLVVHRTPPANLEAYAQEAGRAGRDGEPADVILYYSPNSPTDDDDDNSGRARNNASDHEIQSLFLRDKYVRREDVVVMRAFLKTVKRQIAGNLYFTNDEALGFFENCAMGNMLAGLSAPYTWPKFPLREIRGYESADHATVLDRGHDYKNKTDYLNRILQVLYRIRPTVGDQVRLAFLEQVQDAGSEVIQPKVLDSKAILSSNAYFGQRLRDAGITEPELVRLLNTPDLQALAIRLSLPLHEAASLLRDIKFAEGRFRSGNWKPTLLNFKAIVAPRLGPAANKTSLAAWREYAGAAYRAHGSLAQQRAKIAGRPFRQKSNGSRYYETTLDDWFYWDELNTSRGWEVQPGPAFFDDAHFEQYLDIFMALHDAREANDWAAYHRLLTDYIGVTHDGRILPHQGSQNCLRAVMLGYLKSYEVINGPTCLSCNHCVPNGQFVASLDERRRVVVRLGPRVASLLEQAEACSQIVPAEALIAELFDAVAEEERQGRSIVRYLAGWSGRLLQDTPDHRAALWIRLKAMAEGLFELQPQEFVSNAERLAHLVSDGEVAAARRLLERAHELVPGEPQIHIVQGDLCHRAARYEEEERAWKSLLELPEEGVAVSDQQVVIAYTRLRDLYAPNGPLANTEHHADCLLHLGRLSHDPPEALLHYTGVVKQWGWEQVASEIENCTSGSRFVASASAGLLCAWVAAGGGADIGDRAQRVAAYLAAHGWPLVERSSPAEARFFISRLGTPPFAAYPRLAVRFVELLFAHEEIGPELQKGLDICWIVLSAGKDLPITTVKAASRALARWSWVLFQDAPGYKASLWIRLRAMAEGLVELKPQEYVSSAMQLIRLTSEAEVPIVWRLLARAHEVVPDPADIYTAQADHCRRLGQFRNEEKALQGILALRDRQCTVTDEQVSVVYSRLCALYAPAGPLADPARYIDCLLRLGRLSTDSSSASSYYVEAVRDWTWEQVAMEVGRCASESRHAAGTSIGLLCAWVSGSDRPLPEQRARQVVTYLAEAGWPLIEQAADGDLQLLVSRLGSHALAASSELALDVLHFDAKLQARVKKLTTLRIFVLDSIQEIVSHLMGTEDYGQQAHRVWMAVCSHLPDRLAEYAEICLEVQPPNPEWAEQAFERLLETGDAEYIKVYLKSVRSKSQNNLPRRIALAADFFQAMEDHAKKQAPKLPNDFKREDLDTLWDAFTPQRSVDRADMFVAAIRVLRKRLDRYWKTPIAREANALCEAQRLDEADQLAQQYPELTMGIKGELVSQRVRQLRQSGPGRAADLQDRDYQRIMAACFVNQLVKRAVY